MQRVDAQVEQVVGLLRQQVQTRRHLLAGAAVQLFHGRIDLRHVHRPAGQAYVQLLLLLLLSSTSRSQMITHNFIVC
jgi:hypothetical protein